MLDQFKPLKVGIIPCNGEEICEGTLTRFACRNGVGCNAWLGRTEDQSRP